MLITALIMFALFIVVCAGGVAGVYTKYDLDKPMMFVAVGLVISGMGFFITGLQQDSEAYENKVEQIRKDYPEYVFTDLTTSNAEYYNIKTRKFCKADVNKSNETNKYVVTNPYCKDK